MKEIFESLEVSEETKQELLEAFDSAVLEEATKLAKEKEPEYEAYMLDQIEHIKEELEETLDSYLDKIVEEFVENNAEALQESVEKEKYQAVLEGFNSLLLATGVGISQIAEAKEEGSELNSIIKEKEELEETLDEAVEELIELKKQNAELLKTGLIKESMEDMTEMQKDNFLKLVSVVEFDADKPEEFLDSVNTIVESVKSTKEKEEEIVESVSKEPSYAARARHLF